MLGRSIFLYRAINLEKKILIKPGLYYKKDGIMDRLRSNYDKDVMNRYQSDYDPDANPWINGPDAQTLFPYMFGDFEVGGYYFDVEYQRIWLEMHDGDVVPLEWSFPKGAFKT